MNSNGGEDNGQAASLAGWTGLHLIVGAILNLRGINVSGEALRQAAQATHPLVEGRLPRAVTVIGTYGGIIAELVDGDEHDEEERGQEMPEYTGHTDRPEEEDDSNRSLPKGVDDSVNNHKHRRGDLRFDGSDLIWDS